MIRISKLTDYGIVLLTYFADSDAGAILTAKELSEKTALPLPTVGKILKSLSRGELLASQRGVKGGYRLVQNPDKISIAEIVRVLEGPIMLTDCNSHSPHLCEFEEACPVKSNWRKINQVVRRSLESLTLSEMSKPLPRDYVSQSNQKNVAKKAPLILLSRKKIA